MMSCWAGWARTCLGNSKQGERECTLTSLFDEGVRTTAGGRMSHTFHRNPGNDYPVAVRGDGAYLIDRTGKRYLDASGGAAVSCLGHSDRAVVDAIKAQLDRLPFAHTSFFSNE